MNGKERISRIFLRQPVDRIGIFEHFWPDTHAYYVAQGKISENEDFGDHFGLDISMSWPGDVIIDLDFVPEVIAEDENTVTVKNGNGAILRTHKHHDTTPEHVGYAIKAREDWDIVKHKLFEKPERRINFEMYRNAKATAEKAGRFFCWSGLHVFECMHSVCGHENLLIGMALDPDWVKDMAVTYSELMLEMQKILFKREGLPDGIFYYEDMGFKERPFMSPVMYDEMIMSSHERTISFAHSQGLPVTMHSCGFIEPLLPGMINAGIDCLNVIEVKAGMDLLRIHKEYGDKIALMGGIDVRALYTNDKTIIDKELESKIPIVKQGYGFIAHSDHSIPKTVDYETFIYYIEKVLELGAYA